MKNIIITFLAVFSMQAYACDQECKTKGIDIEEIIQTYSQTTGEKILVDPQVKGKVQLYGQNLKDLNFSNLLTILTLQGYTAYKSDGYIIVIQDKYARTLPIKNVTEGEIYPDNLYVTNVIKLINACAAKMIPVLRPLVPQQGHMAASTGSNSIIVTDVYANTVRIKKIIQDIDSIFKKPENCDSNK